MVKLSGIAFGQRTKQRGQSDLQDLVRLKKFARYTFDMNFQREWYVGFDKEYGYMCRLQQDVTIKDKDRFRWKNPDLVCIDKDFGIIIVELDGAVHDLKVQKTLDRNSLYIEAGIKLVILNIADINYHGQTIEERLQLEILKLIG